MTLVSNEKSILRAEFAEHAADYFAGASAAELAEIHGSISKKLAAYCEKIFTGKNPPERIAIYEPMRFELPVRGIVEAVPLLKDAGFLYPQYDATQMWFLDGITREKSEPDFVIIPGLFVDKAGHRLGRGKGYYDRYLKESPLPKERRVFLGYPFQFLEFVPTTPQDVSVVFIN